MKNFKLLSIFHYILAGIWGLYLLMFALFILKIFFSYSGDFSPYLSQIYASACDSSLTENECKILIISLMIFIPCINGMLFIANLIAALSYQQKKINTFSWIAAVLNLVFVFPITTILGAYSLYILNNHLKKLNKKNNQ